MSDLIQYGYSKGDYTCICGTCHINFEGEKRACCCESCAKNYLIESLQAEVERYKKAMKGAADGVDRIALSIPPPNKYTPRLKMWAIAIRNEVCWLKTLEQTEQDE